MGVCMTKNLVTTRLLHLASSSPIQLTFIYTIDMELHVSIECYCRPCLSSLPEVHTLSTAVVHRYGHTLERESDGGSAGSVVVSLIGRHPLQQTIVGFGSGWSV